MMTRSQSLFDSTGVDFVEPPTRELEDGRMFIQEWRDSIQTGMETYTLFNNEATPFSLRAPNLHTAKILLFRFIDAELGGPALFTSDLPPVSGYDDDYHVVGSGLASLFMEDQSFHM